MNYLDMNPETANRTYKNPFVLSRSSLSGRNIMLFCLVVLAVVALVDFFVLGVARRTFVFYAIDSGAAVVEERMLKASKGNPVSGGLSGGLIVSRRGSGRNSPSQEADIARYVEEALLGPVSPNSLPLFPRETQLRSLLYRNGVVYADFSEDAALPPIESLQNGDVFTNMETLYAGVRRNFPFVREMRFFIAGEAAYPGKFR